MAGSNEVTYTIRLKDQMTKRLKAMGLAAGKVSRTIKSGLVNSLKVARIAMKGLAIAAGLATAAMGAIVFASIRAGRSFIDAASMAEETRSKFGAVFKENTDNARAMAEEISGALGRNQTEVEGFMARLQDTFVPLGFGREEATGLSTSITRLAFDLASFNPEVRNAGEAMDSLTSALVGNHETVRRFGVQISEKLLNQKLEILGVEKVNGVYTEQDKIMARLALIIEGTGDAQGDLIRTQQSWFNQTEKLKSQLTAVREELGDKLKGAILENVAAMGGMDAVIELARTGMTFLAEVLIQMVIPAVFNFMQNAGAFIQALGGIGGATDTVALGVSVMANAFQTAWSAIKLVLYYFNQGFETLVYIVKGGWELLKLLVGLLGLGLVTAFLESAKALAFLYEGMDKFAGFLRDTFISMLQFVIDKLADLVSGFASTLAFLAQAPGLGWLSGMADSAESAANAMRGLGVSMEGMKGGDTWYKDVAEGIKEMIPAVEAMQTSLVGFIEESWEGLAETSSEFVESIMEDVPTINQLWEDVRNGAARTSEEYAELTNRVAEALATINEIEVVTPEQADTVNDLKKHLEEIQAPLTALGEGEDALAEKSWGLSEIFDHLGTAAKDFATDGIPSMEDSMNQIAEGAMTSFADGMTDALMSVIDGSKSAGEAFKAFAAQFLMDVARMIIQTLVFKAIKTAFGVPLADGGIVGGGLGTMTPLATGGVVGGGLGRMMPVKGYATGGPIVSGPHVALVGEGKHNEAVVPLPDGKSIPVEMSGASGTSVNISITAVDALSVDQLLFQRRNTLKDIIGEALGSSRSFRGAVGRA